MTIIIDYDDNDVDNFDLSLLSIGPTPPRLELGSK